MSIFQKIFRAQQLFGSVEKTANNPHFKKNYSDLKDIMKAILPALNATGLLIIHQMEDQRLLTKIIDIETNEELTSSYPIPEIADIQKVGAAITYLKRYNISSLLNLQSEIDDDGNSVSKINLKDKAHINIISDAVSKFNFTPEQKRDLAVKLAGKYFFELSDIVSEFAESTKGAN